jgi:hypothetical protein
MASQPECPRAQREATRGRQCLVSPCAVRSYIVRVEHFAWPFGPERFTAVPTGIGGCSPVMIPVGYSSGTSLTCPQVASRRH